MTTAELGYQQKELEMLIDILKKRLKGEEYPDRPGLELSGIARTILNLIIELELTTVQKLSNPTLINIDPDTGKVEVISLNKKNESEL